MLFRQRFGSANVTSLVERVSRFTVLLKNADKRNAPGDGQGHRGDPCPAPAGAQIDHLRSGQRVRLVAAPASRDRHEQLVLRPLCALIERTVMKTNRRARRWLSRRRGIGQLSDHDIREICDRLNAMSRKCLGWKTPAGVFGAEMPEKRLRAPCPDPTAELRFRYRSHRSKRRPSCMSGTSR